MAIPTSNRTSPATEDPKVRDLMDMFDWAYNESIPDLKRLEDLQKSYDNMVNTAQWPTVAQIPLPLMFVAVERALPDVLNYLFPNTFVKLNPTDKPVPIGVVRNLEQALELTAITRMKLPLAALPTLKDCFKLGVGYGHVDTIVIRPPKIFTQRVLSSGKEITRGKALGLGKPKRAIRYRYVSPGQIVVTPDGSEFDGPDSVSCAFFVDTYNEQDFRDMFKSDVYDIEKVPLKGNVEKIVSEARSLGFDSRTPIVNIISALGGIDMQKTNKNQENLPVVVPVIKCYQNHRHVWIANGTTIIFEQSDKYQTLRRPLVKASAWKDGNRWYPMSAPEAAYHLGIGTNIFVNAMFDLLSNYLNPTMVYDKQKTGNKPPERGPSSDIGVTGSVREAMQYLPPPPLPDGLFTVNDLFQRMFGSAVGQESFMNEMRPGLLRAGGNAFESLLQQTTGRQALANAVLGTGWLQSTMEQILIYMQTNIDASGDAFTVRDWNPETGEEYIQSFSVSEADLLHTFELELDLKAKHRNEAIDLNSKLAKYNAFKDDDFFDPYEVRVEAIGDPREARRLLKPRKQVQELQARRQALAEQAQMGVGQASQTQPTMGPEQQALAGAAAIGGAL